jgi:3-dehydroquinate synthase
MDRFDVFDIQTAIYHSLSIKKAIVEKDEFEARERKALNYGHSFGHAIETACGYKIPHGEAVLLGIEIINRLFTNSDIISKTVSNFTSLSKIRDIDVGNLIHALKTDKKITNGVITFVVAPKAGEIVFRSEKVDEKIGDAVYALLAN